ncbi:MAG: recombinase family protein [Nocardioides sp.]|uniref:recombinase family protein n=1 Tax=Nocardioides sp. TaxID=35761 RepID=UPI0039E42764
MSIPSVNESLSPLRAVSYLRVSTNRQAQVGGEPEGLSIPAQREERAGGERWRWGALVAAEFLERGRSGRSLERPELKRMLDYIVSRPVDFVIVHKIDRLARNRADDAALTNQILATGAHLVLTEVISSSPSERLLHGIMASIAEFYSQNLATEVMEGIRPKAIQGGTPGRAPLGYLNQQFRDQDGREVRTIVIDPERGPHIAWAFEAYATGEWSLNQIASELNERGVTTRPGPNSPAMPLTLRAVHYLLRNPYYAGVVTLNGAEHVGSHEPLVDEATWAAVQDVLATRRNGERPRTHDHHLKGTVYCIECGRRLIEQHNRGRNGTVYGYFVCHRGGNNDCTQRETLPIAQVEQRVADCYRTIALTAEQRERIERIALARLRRQEAHAAERVDQLDAEAHSIERRQVRLLEAYHAAAVPQALFLKNQQRLKTERAHNDHARRTAVAVLADLEQEVRGALDLLQNIHETCQQATPIVRKQLNGALFARVLLGAEPTQVRVELNEPYDALTSGNSLRDG